MVLHNFYYARRAKILVIFAACSLILTMYIVDNTLVQKSMREAVWGYPLTGSVPRYVVKPIPSSVAHTHSTCTSQALHAGYLPPSVRVVGNCCSENSFFNNFIYDGQVFVFKITSRILFEIRFTIVG